MALFKKTGTSGGGQEQFFAESILAKKTKTVREYDCEWIPHVQHLREKLQYFEKYSQPPAQSTIANASRGFDVSHTKLQLLGRKNCF